MLKDSLHTEDTWKAVIGEMLCGGPIYQYESILEPSDLAFTPEASEIFHCDGLMDPNKPLALKRKLGGGGRRPLYPCPPPKSLPGRHLPSLPQPLPQHLPPPDLQVHGLCQWFPVTA